MARQLIIALLLLLGLDITHAAGKHRPLAQQQAKTLRDPFAWIGPLPATISDTALNKRWDRLGDKVFASVQAPDPRRFVCKSPAEVGPVPMMSAVERYIDGAPESLYDDEVLSELNEAAARGNWLARTLILFWLNERSKNEYQYRAVVLAEWMYHRRLGQLYVVFGDALMASGYGSGVPGDRVSGFDIMAAMRHSYVAQNKVGNELSRDPDPELAAAGRKMLACASGSLGAYERMFAKEKKK